MKSAFWKTDWFFGLVVVLAFFCFKRASDLHAEPGTQGLRPGREGHFAQRRSDKIAVIAIDDAASPTSAAGRGRARCTRR